MVGLTRAQLREVAESRHGRQQRERALDMTTRAERSVAVAQAYVVPLYERVLM